MLSIKESGMTKIARNILCLGVALVFLAQPVLADGTATYLERGDLKFYPVRQAAEGAGYAVSWDAERQEVVMKNESHEIRVKQGFSWYSDNGIMKELSMELVNENGTLYGSLAVIRDMLSAEVVSSGGFTAAAGASYLTKDQLIESAFSYDKGLKVLRNQLKGQEELLDDAENTGTTVLPFTGNGATDAQISATWQNILGTRVAKDLAESAIDNRKNVIRFQLEALYDGLIVKNDATVVYEKALAYAQASQSEAKLKYDNGLISAIDYDKAVNAVATADNNLKMQRLSVDETKASIARLTGVPSGDVLVGGELTLQPLKDFNLDSAYMDVVANSFSILSLEGNIQVAKYGVDYYVFNSSGSAPYEVKELSLSNAKIALDVEKDSLRQTMLTTWKEILKAEEQNRIYQVQLSEKMRDMETLSVQRNIGLATDLQIKGLSLTIEQLKLSIEQNNMNHAQLMRTLEKPWLSASGS